MRFSSYATYHVFAHFRHALIVSGGLAVVTVILFAAAWTSGANIPAILADLSVSFWRVSVAYVLSLVFALIVGIAVTRTPRIEAAALPILDVLQSFPNFALLPIAIAWFGAGSGAIIFILVITMVWPILFAVVAGTKTVRAELGEAAHIFGARGMKYLRAFLLPSLFPAVVSGSIVGWGEGWEAVVGTEIIAKSSGIGSEIVSATEAGDTRAVVILLTILMYVIFLINTWVWLQLLRRSVRFSE